HLAALLTARRCWPQPWPSTWAATPPPPRTSACRGMKEPAKRMGRAAGPCCLCPRSPRSCTWRSCAHRPTAPGEATTACCTGTSRQHDWSRRETSCVFQHLEMLNL
ncbi:hypothetical protein IHE44_0008885, partial [Lamprotornis superbus]